MATGRNASSLLVTLLMTIVFFALFVGISSIDMLSRHAYDFGYGWQASTVKYPAGDCAHPYTNTGFPLKNTKDDRRDEDPSGCEGSSNPLARSMDLALFFAAAAILSAGIVGVAKERLSV